MSDGNFLESRHVDQISKAIRAAVERITKQSRLDSKSDLAVNGKHGDYKIEMPNSSQITFEAPKKLTDEKQAEILKEGDDCSFRDSGCSIGDTIVESDGTIRGTIIVNRPAPKAGYKLDDIIQEVVKRIDGLLDKIA